MLHELVPALIKPCLEFDRVRLAHFFCINARFKEFLFRGALKITLFASLLLPFPGIAAITVPTPGSIQDSIPENRSPVISSPPQVIFYNETANPEDQPESKRFLVSGFNFVGNSVVNSAVLQRITERYLDLQLTLGELDQAVANITAYYRDQGYTVARAYVPAQSVVDGLVTIQIIEGHLGSVSFKGQNRYRSSFLQSYLDKFIVRKKDEPTSGEVVTDAGLERRLLLLNDLPGLKARATLLPGDEFGTTNLFLELEEKLFGASLGYSNSGTKESGENRIDAGVTINNPFTLGDQLSYRHINSTDNLFTYEQVGYAIPLGYDGLKLGISTLSTNYDLGGEFKTLDISGKVRSSDITLSYPFVRTRAKNIIGALQYRQTKTEQTALGVLVSSATLPLTVASVYANWVEEDSSATAINIAYSTNFWYHGDNSSQEHVASKLETDLTYLTGATRNWDFFLHTQGAYSSASLPDTEKFSLGGADSVRGYSSAEVRGDKGYLVTMELRNQWRVRNVPGYFSLFVDTGGVNNKGFEGYDRISSAGAGLVFYAGNFGRFKLEYAKPLSSRNARDGKDERVWFNLSLGY